MCRASAAGLKVTGYVLLIIINENHFIPTNSYISQPAITAKNTSDAPLASFLDNILGDKGK